MIALFGCYGYICDMTTPPQAGAARAMLEWEQARATPPRAGAARARANAIFLMEALQIFSLQLSPTLTLRISGSK